MAKGKKKNSTKKKESKRIEEVSVESSILDKVFVALGVLVFLLAFYLLTLHITNKNTKDTDKKEETTTSSDTIMLGRSLSMSDGEYFVIYYDTTDEDNADTYKNLSSSYAARNSVKVYTVDMNSGLNKGHATDGESNKNPNDESELLINGATLIKVSEGKVVEYIEGMDSIKGYLE